jgi:hypothetical protein
MGQILKTCLLLTAILLCDYLQAQDLRIRDYNTNA